MASIAINGMYGRLNERVTCISSIQSHDDGR
jgi:hypothetical protein